MECAHLSSCVSSATAAAGTFSVDDLDKLVKNVKTATASRGGKDKTASAAEQEAAFRCQGRIDLRTTQIRTDF